MHAAFTRDSTGKVTFAFWTKKRKTAKVMLSGSAAGKTPQIMQNGREGGARLAAELG